MARPASEDGLGKWVRIVAPPALTFRKHNNDETVLFLHRIYREVVELGHRVTIDLRAVEDMSFGAALALVAEINRAEEITPGRILRGILPRDPRLSSVLHELGFVAATTPGQPSAIGEPSSLLRVHTGLAEDASDTAFLEEFLQRIFPPEIMSDRVRGRLKGAVKEALLNVVDHAYDEALPRSDHCPSKRWWMCGWAREKDGCHFVFYDLGVGIPATIPNTAAAGVRDAFEALGQEERGTDFELIKVAVVHPSSRTGRPGRGRGLPEMRRLIDRVGEGMLWITSGKGHYIYSQGANDMDGGFAMNHRLHGTLVVWRLKVSDALDDPGGHDD